MNKGLRIAIPCMMFLTTFFLGAMLTYFSITDALRFYITLGFSIVYIPVFIYAIFELLGKIPKKPETNSEKLKRISKTPLP